MLQYEVSPIGYSPSWTVPVWVSPMGCCFSIPAPAWVLSTVYSLSGMDCSSIGPPQATVPSRKCALGVGPLWATSTCLPCTAVWISAPLCSFTGCSETTSVTMVFTGSRTISGLVPGASPPSPSLTLVSVGLFPSCFSHSSHVIFFYPFLSMSTQRYYWCSWWAQLWPAVGLF